MYLRRQYFSTDRPDFRSCSRLTDYLQLFFSKFIQNILNFYCYFDVYLFLIRLFVTGQHSNEIGEQNSKNTEEALVFGLECRNQFELLLIPDRAIDGFVIRLPIL